ncbi:MAG: ThuA domain-containing protein [Novosphingobium sp.]
MIRKIVRGVLIVLALALAFVAVQTIRNWDTIRRTMLGGLHTHETVPPVIPVGIKRPAILVFSKTNGFRHEEAIPAANAMLAQLAKDKGWGYYQTENGAAFTPAVLSQFDAVVFNNASGDVFNADQQAAFKTWIENSGGYVGIHAAGDDSWKGWRWYTDEMIGANFIGHPFDPQFQMATVRIEDAGNPSTIGLPKEWKRVDEWYSFDKPARKPGYTVLATLDEATFANHKIFSKNIAMGKDHPIAWWHCVGPQGGRRGRVFYSAMGHQASAYAEPEYKAMLTGAISWALRLEGTGCDASGAKP